MHAETVAVSASPAAPRKTRSKTGAAKTAAAKKVAPDATKAKAPKKAKAKREKAPEKSDIEAVRVVEGEVLQDEKGASKGGRPAYEPDPITAAKIIAWSAVGVRQADMGYMLGISVDTIQKYYPNETHLGAAQANANVAARLYKVATEGQGKEALTAMIFWTKARMGWSEKQQIELSGPGGKPLEVEINLSDMTTAEILALESLGKKFAALNAAAATASVGSD